MGLLQYLVMSARGDLLNALERETAITSRVVPFSVVEDNAEDRNRLLERAEVATYDEYDLGDEDQDTDLLERVRREIPDATDLRIVELLLSGERRTSEYARILNLQDRAQVERERVVKQNKDRLKKRLVRLGVKLK
jgi:hypothetical protein